MNNLVGLLSTNELLRNEFLVKVFKSFEGKSPSFSSSQIMKMTASRICSAITKDIPDRIQFWTFKQDDRDCSFLINFESSQTKLHPCVYIVLLSSKEMINKTILQPIRGKSDDNLQFLIIVDHSEESSQDLQKNRILFHQKIISFFTIEINFKLKEEDIIGMSLDQFFDIRESQFSKRLILHIKRSIDLQHNEPKSNDKKSGFFKWISDSYQKIKEIVTPKSKQAGKRLSMTESPIPKQLNFDQSHPRQLREKTLENYRKNAKDSLLLFIFDFQVQDATKCITFLLSGDIQGSLGLIHEDFKKAFVKKLQKCLRYREYLEQLAFQNVLKQLENSIHSLNSQDQRSMREFFKDTSKDIFQTEDKMNDFDDLFVITANGVISKEELQLVKDKMMYEILNRFGLVENSIQNVIKEINNGCFTSLSQLTDPYEFYSIQYQVFHHKQFTSFLNKNKAKFLGKISYFEFFIHTAQDMDALLNSIMSENNSDRNDEWMVCFNRGNKKEKLNVIDNEIMQLLQIEKYANKQNRQYFVRLLEQLIRKIALESYKDTVYHLENLQIEHNLTINQATINLNVIQRQKAANPIDNSNTRKQIYQNIILLHEIKELCLQKMGFDNFRQIAQYFMKVMAEDKIKMQELSNCFLRQRSIVRAVLASNNLIEYCNAKAKQLRFATMQFFYQNYENEVNKLMIKVVFEDIEKTILLPEKMKASQMAQIVAQALKIPKETLIYECEFQKEIIIIDQIDMLIKKPQQINCYQKISTQIQLKDSFFKFNISKNISKISLKKLALQRLKRENIEFIEQKTFVFGVFGQSSQPVEISNNLEIMEMKERGSLKFLLIKFHMNINIFYEAELFQFEIQGGKRIEDLKTLIFETTKIPIKSQCLLYQRQDTEEEIFSQRLDEIQPNSISIAFTLLSKVILEHYGFHENYSLSFKQYSEFYIEREQDLKDMIDSCSLKKEEEKNFFDQLIRFLYSAVKRKFSFSYITDQIRDKMLQKNAQQIWSGKDFTQYFLVYYLLYNADNQLKIELMNILRTFVPLPLYFRTFNKINEVKKQWKINSQIIWLLHSGLCVTSIGFHTENVGRQKGKTFLNNQLFFTNFQPSHQKHPISQGCPEIFSKVLGSIMPINFIDVPAEAPESITNDILSITKFLIIHSWTGKKSSEKKIREIQSLYNIQFVICFLRDSQNKQQTNTKVRNVKFDQSIFLELHNLEQNAAAKKDPAFMKILRDKVWDYQSKAFSKKEEQNFKDVLYLFNNKLFNQYEEKMAAIRSHFFDLKVVFNKYEEIKNLKKQKNLNVDYHIIENKQKQLVAKKVALQYQETLLFINKNNYISQTLMLRLRETLKQLKNQEERKYYIINLYKKKMVLLPATKKEEFQALMEKSIRDINALPKMKKIKRKATQRQMVEQLSNAFDYFENQIKSMFFTIEYAWRQLQYLTKIDHKVYLKDLPLLDFLIDTKRKEIANSQPFEILDGDLLQMPKNIISKSFEGRKDRVAVITILGPQSSGKSTLLNFLFGCDFGTSQGRCTKGVYGTYFEFNKNILTNCDGIFLIDTEGLFATVNKKDSTRRKDFDSKLVLFCLAISDFVIVNTKGNLDSESTRILKSSLDRLPAVGIEAVDRPEIYLVLNQNNSGNLMTSQADINNMREIFSNQSTFSLNQAFNLTELSKKDISILPEDENVVKRQPREEFLALTDPIKQSLMTKIEAKRNIKQISVAIDFMEKLWTTIQSFPDLGKSSSKKCQQLQASINQWKICKLQTLRVVREQIFNKFKQGLINQKKSHQALNHAVEDAGVQFKLNYLSESSLEEMSEEQVMKVKLQEKTIQLGFESIKYELRYNIKDLQKDKMAEKCKTQGSEYQKEAIRVVKKKQRQEKRELSQEEKQKYFNEAFNKSLQKIQQIETPQKQLETYFERTFQFYSNSLSTSATNNDKKTAGLPKAEWKCDLKMDFQQFSQKIQGKIEDKLGKDSNQYIEYRKNPPTKILDASTRTDAKLNYFNMRNYFSKKKVIYFFEISRLNLRNCLKTELFNYQFKQQVQRKERFENILKNCFEEINNFFYQLGFKIADFQQFIQCYLFFTSNKVFNFFKNQPKLQIQMINNSKKDEKTNQKNCPHKQTKNLKIQKKSNNNPVQIQHLISINLEEPIFPQRNIVDSKLKNISQKGYMYIDENVLDKKLEMFDKINQTKSNQNKPQTNFLAKCIKDIIKWKQIQREVKRGKQFKQSQQKMSKDISDIINRDLAKIGLISQCSDYYAQIFENCQNISSIQFDCYKNCPSFQKQEDFYKLLSRITAFDTNKLKTCLSKSYDKQSSKLRIASFQEETFQVLPQYQKTRQLSTYISTSTNEVFYNLKSDTMKQFVFSELILKESWKKFFSNLNKIVEKSPNYFNRDTITNIYVDVCKEIVEFNNDLNQVSHKLTLLFTGYAHLYAIYMIWKKFSEMAVEEANKPYNDLLKTKSKKLQFFMKETSNNDNTKSQGESDRFINEVLDYCRQIIENHKLKTNKNQAQKFKHQNPRKVIQEKIDRECFSTASKQDDWINYLTNPAKVIEEKYQSLTKLSLLNLKSDYQKCDKLTQLIQQFKQAIKLILNKLKTAGVSQDTIHTDIFSIVKKTDRDIIIADNEVEQIIDGMVMDYLLDLMIQEHPKTYMHQDFNIELNHQYQDIKVIREPTPVLQALVAKLRQKNMVITRLFLFVDMVYRKLEQKSISKHSIEVEEFTNQIKMMIEFKEEDQNNFRSLMNIKICKQLCPGCSRICGVEEAHINKHECKYGHQMRALGGVKLNNGEASVIRCEDVHPMNIVEFNGKKKTWLQFKQQWENRTEGSWSFSDLATDTNKEIFLKAWDICGKSICDKNQMKYVKSNAIDQQKMGSAIMQPLHYIFALDDSGSMSGSKWQELMNSFKSTVQNIQQIANSEQYIRISIILIGSNNYTHQENVTPKSVNMSIPFRCGGTYFTPTFACAYQLMQKYRNTSKIRFICMTDGEAEYPATEVAQIKTLKSADPNRIEYFGIEFQANGNIMKQISTELDGRNSITYTGSQLTSTYFEIINRK